MKILMVCTGNTCRSPMAQELLDDAIGRSTRLDGNVKCSSAGTFACEGAEPTEEAVQVLEEMGLNIEKHRARQFTEEIAEKADLILAMGPLIYEQMAAIAPSCKDRMHMFLGFGEGLDGELHEEAYSVIDPFDEDVDEYRRCAKQLAQGAERIVRRLESQAE